MSWMKRPAVVPPPQQQVPTSQTYGNNQNHYPDFQQNETTPSIQPNDQHQYWAQPQQYQHNQFMPGGGYQTQEYINDNNNQLYQAYPPQNYNYQNMQQLQPQGTMQQHQQHQQQSAQSYFNNQPTNMPQSNTKQEGWEDNWDWGWDDATKQAKTMHNQGQPQYPNHNRMEQEQVQPPTSAQHQPSNTSFMHTNVIEESFTSNNSWNWSKDENADKSQLAPTVSNSSTYVGNSSSLDHQIQHTFHLNSHIQVHNDSQNVINSTGSQETSNIPIGTIEVIADSELIPQFSVDSQLSLESSDGNPTQTESNNLIENISRNSNSPSLNMENFDYSQLPPPCPEFDSNQICEQNDTENLTKTLQNITLSNQDNVVTSQISCVRSEPSSYVQTEQSVPQNQKEIIPPICYEASGNNQVNTQNETLIATQPSASGSLNLQNSMNNTTSISQKQHLNPQIHVNPNLSSPAAVNKVQQDKDMVCYGANLETTPENFERPDQPQLSHLRTIHPMAVVPDNMEVAPRNDRNEYLQTAHLSSGDFSEGARFNQSAPLPKGLRRMVVGQHKTEYGQGLNVSSDEPPPGLARMVPGQQTDSDNTYNSSNDNFFERHIDGQPTTGPAASAVGSRPNRQADGRQADRPSALLGLDRMVPGEPSSQQFAPFTSQGRIVTGLEHEYGYAPTARAYNADESVGLETSNDQREVTMDGENLQDLSVASSVEVSLRDSTADLCEAPSERQSELNEFVDMPQSNSRRHSSGDESERDKIFKSSPRRERQKTPRDRERDRDNAREKDKRPERKSERRSTRDTGDRKQGKSTRSRKYETEDTDYYSDKERDRRHYREGSYSSSKPPRPEEKERRRRDERDRRYEGERDRRYEGEKDRRYEGERDRRYEGERERRYRDIDPNRVGRHAPLRHRDSRGAKYGADEDRERRKHRRDYYDAESVGMAGVVGSGPTVSREEYAYYERLRRTDPAAYLLIYQRLMANNSGYSSLNFDARTDDRASVHSARSSNGQTNLWSEVERRRGSIATDISEREALTETSMTVPMAESNRSDRMTPLKFATPHVKGVMSVGHLVMCGSSDFSHSVKLMPLTWLLSPALNEFPGPLTHDTTHKSAVLGWCRNRKAMIPEGNDASGEHLVWEYLITLITHNGVVVGSDLAELLLKNINNFPNKVEEKRRGSVGSGSASERDRDISLEVNDLKALQLYRELLLTGDRHQALEIAMNAGQWGHALFLSASESAHLRSMVLSRFLSSLEPSDPLRVLYTLQRTNNSNPNEMYSGDWREHAAIILSNSPPGDNRNDQYAKAIINMGDRLWARGCHWSAQFCWLAVGVASPRLTLLLADASSLSLARIPDISICATEVLEYAHSLHNHDYYMPDLQRYKLVLAQRLLEAGELQRASLYCDVIGRRLSPGQLDNNQMKTLSLMADRLQYTGMAMCEENDPIGSEHNSPRKNWVNHLNQQINQSMSDSRNMSYDLPPLMEETPSANQSEEQSVPFMYQNQYWPQSEMQYQPMPAPLPEPIESQEQPQPDDNQSQWLQPENTWLQPEDNHYNDSYNWQQNYNEEANRPQITMPGAARYSQYEDNVDSKQQESNDSPVSGDKKEEKSSGGIGNREDGGKSGWLGGIFTKLSLRPNNQMILPDDTNPTIVWDEEHKRWRNTDESETENVSAPPPPPTAQQLNSRLMTPPSSGGIPPGLPPSGNIFKMQKGRNIKKAYVDVFNPNTAQPKPQQPGMFDGNTSGTQ